MSIVLLMTLVRFFIVIALRVTNYFGFCLPKQIMMSSYFFFLCFHFLSFIVCILCILFVFTSISFYRLCNEIECCESKALCKLNTYTRNNKMNKGIKLNYVFFYLNLIKLEGEELIEERETGNSVFIVLVVEWKYIS